MNQLLKAISHCDEIEKAKKDINHPCYKIINFQEETKPFQNPEPWNGNINKADILFVGSNPSYNPNEEYPTNSWTDEEIFKYHNNRFLTDYYQKNKNKVMFWQKTRKISSWLLNIPLDDLTLEDHICLTEIVHCKSTGEKGFSESCDMCFKKWMDKVLKEFRGSYIVVFGNKANEVFTKYTLNNINGVKKIIFVPHPSRWHFIGSDDIIREKYFN